MQKLAASNMKASLRLSALLFLLSFPLATASVEITCRRATGSGDAYRLCVSALRTVPHSQVGNTREVAAVLVQQLVANYSDFVERLKDLIDITPLPPEIKEALEVCLDAYVTGIQRLTSAIDNMKAADIFGAIADLAVAATAAGKCKDACKLERQQQLLEEYTNASAFRDVVLRIIAFLSQ